MSTANRSAKDVEATPCHRRSSADDGCGVGMDSLARPPGSNAFNGGLAVQLAIAEAAAAAGHLVHPTAGAPIGAAQSNVVDGDGKVTRHAVAHGVRGSSRNRTIGYHAAGAGVLVTLRYTEPVADIKVASAPHPLAVGAHLC